MHIYNEDGTITIKCSDGKFRTFHLEEIDFEYYIRTSGLKRELGESKKLARSNFKKRNPTKICGDVNSLE
jgi:hypothetical protein